MDVNELFLRIAETSPLAAVIGFIVWWGQQKQEKILRSMDLRLAKLLEHMRRVAPTPPYGVPIAQSRERSRGHRQRSVHDSDMAAEDNVTIPRTVTDEDVDP